MQKWRSSSLWNSRIPIPDKNPNSPYVTRGGDKLEFVLSHFQVDPAGKIAADLGSHIGGFVDCLLQRGAERVYSVDTSYGTLAWKLRQDPRVVVLERTNAMHVTLPEPVDLVTIDVAWTRQRLILPHALTLVKPGGLILSLIKTQYEADPATVLRGRLPEELADGVAHGVIEQLRAAELPVIDYAPSPIEGGKGNREYWVLLRGNTG